MMWLSLIKSSEGLNRNLSNIKSKSDWILHISQCFDHNFRFRSQIGMKFMVLESL
jgi:hypothetical protein